MNRSAFDALFNASMNGLDGNLADAELKSRIVKLEGQVATLQAQNIRQQDALVKLNGLMKECIARIEGR